MCEHAPYELAQALFCSCVQPTAGPTADLARQVAEEVLHRRGARACLCEVAQEAGDHPDAYLARIRWCWQAIEPNDGEHLHLQAA